MKPYVSKSYLLILLGKSSIHINTIPNDFEELYTLHCRFVVLIYIFMLFRIIRNSDLYDISVQAETFAKASICWILHNKLEENGNNITVYISMY